MNLNDQDTRSDAERETIAVQIAGATAIICQAEAILDLVINYADMPPEAGDATSGARTVLRAAIHELGKIEVAARAADRGQA